MEKRPETVTPAWLRAAPFIFLLLWSAGFPIAKLGLQYAEPLTMLTLRFALAVGVLAPIFLVMRPPLPRRPAQWAHLAVIGLLVQAGYFGLSWLSLSLGVSAAVAALILALQPVLVAVLAPHLVGEAVGLLRWVGLALGLAGAAVVILARMAVEAGSALGLLAATGALFAMAAGTLYEKRFGISHHPVTSNLLQYTVGLAAVLPLAYLLEEMHVEWTAELAGALTYLVVANSLVAITLLLAMIRHGEAARVSALFYLVPPVTALVAWGLIGEAMPPLAWVGMAIAVLGVALVGRGTPQIKRR